MTSWWEDPATDWTDRQPGRVLQLLTSAYDQRDAVRPFAAAAGLDWRDAPGPSAATRDLWLWVLRNAAAKGLVLDLVAGVLEDASSDAFHVPLRRLLGEMLFATDVRRILRHGLPTSAEELNGLRDQLRAAAAQPADSPVGVLQAITAPPDGLGDPAAYAQAILDATRRVAMIQVDGLPRGTGLLVGPDLLLTAAHVLDARALPPPALSGVKAVFDFYSCGRSPAETGLAVGVTQFIAGSLPAPAEVAGAAAADWDAPADRLDFALLRLERPVPPPAGPDGAALPRGYYRLDPDPYAFDHASLLFIVQHPLGAFQAFSYVTRPPEANGTRTRIRYRGNTLAGSSGSPVLDARGRLVALHHYSTAGTNQAVPISEIARALQHGPYAALFATGVGGVAGAGGVAGGGGGGGAGGGAVPAPVPAPPAVAPLAAGDPFTVSELIGRPFINREVLRGHVREMAKNPQQRTLVITGDSGSGVSYSYDLLSHVASQSGISQTIAALVPDGLDAVRIDLRKYINVPVEQRCMRIADDLTVALGLRLPTEPIATEARNITTLQQWIGQALRHTGLQRWIFFDSIDDEVVARQGGTDELLHAVMELAMDAQVPLRIVLGGRLADQFSPKHTAWAQKDVALGLPRQHVADWVRARVGETGRVIDPAGLDRELDALYPPGAPDPLAADIAPRLPAILLRLTGGGA